jgi:His Kinase A (phospho-acceptor) domain
MLLRFARSIRQHECALPLNRLVAPAPLRCKRAGSQSFATMAKSKLTVADSAGYALTRANAERASCAPINWRQLSHELRTPLNAILGNTELLLDGSSGPLSAQARACLGEVQAAGRQLLRQVQLLLAWSELCVSKPELAEYRVDLIALVREALTGDAGCGSGGTSPRPAADMWRPVTAANARRRDRRAERPTFGGACGQPRDPRRPERAALCLVRLLRGPDKCLADRADRDDRPAAGCGRGSESRRPVPVLAGATARLAGGNGIDPRPELTAPAVAEPVSEQPTTMRGRRHPLLSGAMSSRGACRLASTCLL